VKLRHLFFLLPILEQRKFVRKAKKYLKKILSTAQKEREVYIMLLLYDNEITSLIDIYFYE